ncbi:acyl-CoA carboxylase epsilon subunit [Streptomyces bauhiniae]|uniref:acyl-CoA carboxylase epsilon subunit n=1 Tax=Streptomyces bauhiniae TaxID=2340725 RepID=UPI00345509D4
MTTALIPDTAPVRPSDLLSSASLRVLRGAPSAEELAAVAAVLVRCLADAPAPAAPGPDSARWSRLERAHRYACPRSWHN